MAQWKQTEGGKKYIDFEENAWRSSENNSRDEKDEETRPLLQLCEKRNLGCVWWRTRPARQPIPRCVQGKRPSADTAGPVWLLWWVWWALNVFFFCQVVKETQLRQAVEVSVFKLRQDWYFSWQSGVLISSLIDVFDFKCLVNDFFPKQCGKLHWIYKRQLTNIVVVGFFFLKVCFGVKCLVGLCFKSCISC